MRVVRASQGIEQFVRQRSSMPEGRVIDVDVSSEMESSYLEYAYSVIYSRALPDARNGLKPVQRRIVYQMGDMRSEERRVGKEGRAGWRQRYKKQSSAVN